MKIESLETTGFRSYRKPQTLDLSNLPPGLYAVQGKNGSGKSTFFDMVHWTIFGQTSRGLKAGSIKSWNADVTSSTVLVVDGARIERGWAPNYLRVDGVDTAQEALEQAMRISPNIALHTFHFSQFEDFFIDLKPLQRMEIYSDVLGLELWEQKATAVSKMTKEAVKDRHILEVEKARFEERADTLSKIDLSKNIEDWETSYKEAVVAAKKFRDEEKESARTVKAEEADKDKELKQVEKKYKEVLSLAAEARRKAVQAAQNADEKKVEAVSAELGLTSIKDRRNTFKQISKSVCPTCFQPISSAHKRKHLAEMDKEIENMEKNVKELKAVAEQAQRNKLRAEAVKNDILEDLTKWDTRFQTLERRVKDLFKEVEKAAFSALRAEEKLDKLKKETNPFIEQQKDNEKKARAALRLAKAKEEEIEDAHNFEAALAFWQKGFKDIRYQVMQESLIQLNAEVNESLHDLGLEGWKMTFEVEQETKKGTVKRGFLCTVFSPESPESGVPWESWSGGESQRLRTASQLGIANMISSYLGLDIDVEFWDEPSTWLDEQGIKDLLAVLQERAQRYQRRIFLADHRALDFSFDGVLSVTKTDREGSIWLFEHV